MKVLIVDPDPNLVESLKGLLRSHGYSVFIAFTLERAEIEWKEQEPDLVLMDTALKDVDALAMCQRMRRIHDCLVLVMTDSADVKHEIRCLDSGVDDYLRKPFHVSQLLARMRALSRRVRSTLAVQPLSIVKQGCLVIDALNKKVTVKGKEVHLTPTETKLLYFLGSNANQVCTSEQIVTYVWGFGNDGDICLIKAHIRHLRQKIEPNPSYPEYIKTIVGVGYTLRIERSAESVVM